MSDASAADNPRGPQGASLTELVATDTVAPPFSEVFPRPVLVRMGVLALLFCALNYWQFQALYRGWMDDPNWSHGFIIPLFSLYLIYTRWSELATAPRRTSLWGVPVILAGLALILLGPSMIRTNAAGQGGMILLLFGIVLYLAGVKVSKIMWLPIFYLLLAVPLPDLLYTRIAAPLQKLAALGSSLILKLSRVQGVSVNESNITLLSMTGVTRNLTVAEACAGMRLLMAFLALGIAMAYIGARPLWQRIVLVTAGIPIAVFCNVIRVTITSFMFVIDRPELGQDFMHKFTGLLMLIPALGMLWLLGLVLNSLLVEVDEEEEPAAGGETGGEAKP